ncbi:MAG TPA: DUF1854 domain-containing protein [Rhodocyclaceae bacterium]|nr:DUF1854 domain-containing protein [Rhodocyclaceae bacterium]
MSTFTLTRNPAGRLICRLPDGTLHTNVTPVRAFPLAAPDEGLALMSQEGHEIVWIENLANLDATNRSLIEEELGSREFMPEVRRIVDVSSFATPSTWQIETSRGNTALVLKGEEDIRRLPDNGLLIADNHGILYLIRDRKALDRHSRKILERFL